jgi:hypothetical protein
VPQTPVRITSVPTDHVAGHALTIFGTSAADKLVVVRGKDHKRGRYELGETVSGSDGRWQLSKRGGLNYNTLVQASSGTQVSNIVNVTVHQVLKIKRDNFIGQSAKGFRYRLTGSSASHIPSERISVTLNGRVTGSARMHSNGTFTVTFATTKRHQRVTLHGNGRNGSGVVYTLAAKRTFRV